MKVLFIDSWTKGLPNFNEIIKSLGNNNKYILYHYGSLFENEPNNFYDNNIEIIDYKKYETFDFNKVLLDIRPDIVIKLTFYYPMDWMHFKVARYNKIKTIYFAHGIMSVSGLKSNSINQIKYKYFDIQKIKKWIVFFYIILLSIIGIKKEIFKNIFEFISILVKSLILKHRFWFGEVRKRDELSDYAIVYSKLDKEKIISMGYYSENVFIVGMPQMDEVFYKFNQIDKSQIINNKNKWITIFTTNLRNSNLVNNKFYQFQFSKLINKLEDLYSNHEIYIKIHPLERKNDFCFLKTNNCYIIQNEFELSEILKSSDIILTEPTSLFPVCIDLGLNVYYLNIYNIQMESFDRIALENKIYINNVEDIDKIININKDKEIVKISKEFKYIGYFDGQSRNRIKYSIQKILDIYYDNIIY